MTLLSPATVARRLGLSVDRVVQLDDDLTPFRVDGRGARVYDRKVVEAYAARRDSKKAEKAR